MSPSGFSDLWTQFVDQDPYAALGISVTADERRILKRYRQVAKLLHPDAQVGKDDTSQTFAHETLAKVIYPAYQKLKQEKSRAEILATLRFKVRRLSKNEQLNPSFESAQQLLRIPDAEVELFYEQTVSQIATTQFDSPAQYQKAIHGLSQLNLVFLRRKMGNLVIREKRTGLIAAPVAGPATRAVTTVGAPAAPEPPPINYAEKHGIRALTYLRQQKYALATQELREALKIEPDNVEFHSLIGQAYYMQKMPGMAKVHFRRALALNPTHKVVNKYAQLVGLTGRPASPRPPRPQAAAEPPAAAAQPSVNATGQSTIQSTVKSTIKVRASDKAGWWERWRDRLFPM